VQTALAHDAFFKGVELYGGYMRKMAKRAQGAECNHK